MHLQPVFAGCRAVGGVVSEGLFEKGLCLPSGSNLAKEDQERVVGIVRGCCGGEVRELRIADCELKGLLTSAEIMQCSRQKGG